MLRVPGECTQCGAFYSKRNRSEAKWIASKFCSWACYHASTRGIKRAPRTLQHCANISAAKKGKKPRVALTAEQRLNRSLIRRGDKSHFWRGGRTAADQIIRSSAAMQAWRKAVFARDDWTCQHCGDRGVRLNADHIKPFSTYPDLRFELTNGRTLCVPCHRKTPTYAQKVTRAVVR